jgi:putative transcriptional regulator
MSKKVADELMAGLREAIGYVEGRRARGMRVWEIPPGQIKAARERLELSQSEFADRFGFSVRNLQKWEQGAARPSGAARAFLTVIAREPRAVMRALGTMSAAGRASLARVDKLSAPRTRGRTSSGST